MELPAAVKPAFWGAVSGAIVLAIVGFTWGGWVTYSTAQKMASDTAQNAVVKAVVPYCVARFEHLSDAAAQWDKLKKTDEFDQGSLLEKLGVAVLPGSKLESDTTDTVASECASRLVAIKQLPGVKAAATNEPAMATHPSAAKS